MIQRFGRFRLQLHHHSDRKIGVWRLHHFDWTNYSLSIVLFNWSSVIMSSTIFEKQFRCLIYWVSIWMQLTAIFVLFHEFMRELCLSREGSMCDFSVQLIFTSIVLSLCLHLEGILFALREGKQFSNCFANLWYLKRRAITCDLSQSKKNSRG